MILISGATGMLGSRIASRLRKRDLPVRALVRPTTDASALEAMGVEIARGDLRDPASLARAVEGASAVVSTANTIARVMAGDRSLKIRDVDDRGHANLIDAARAAGVPRFVFISFANEVLDSNTPFSQAKRATEARLHESGLRTTIVRPEMFQEVWLTELVQFDWRNGKLTIFGKGETPHRYVAVDDVAAAVAEIVVANDPPAEVHLAGPEALSRREAADAFERATGRPMKRSHVPRPALRIGSVVLRPFRPVLASIMGQALASDSHGSEPDDAELRALGIDPRPARAYIDEVASSTR